MPYAIDLFCGAGGFSEGIIQAGFNIVFSSDKSPMVEETYTNRHKQLGLVEGVDTHFELADIKDLTTELIFKSINNLKYGNIFEPGSIDAIFGGPPCQGFSRLGKRDTKDPRNMLFHEYLRIIKDIQPRYVVMENVTGILDMRMLDFPSVLSNNYYAGQTLVQDILNSELIGLGYTVLDVQVLNAAHFGVPQQRNRVVFLAYRNDVVPVTYPVINNDRTTVYDAFGSLYPNTDFQYDTQYSFSSLEGRTPNVITGRPIPREYITNMETSKHETIVQERFSLYRQGENRRKAVNRLKNTGINLRTAAPSLFYESLFQLNSKTNAVLIKKTLEKLNLLANVNINDKWLHFTNRQLSLLKQFHDLHDDISFKRTILSLSSRLNTNLETTKIFWNKINKRLNKEIDEITYHNELLNGEISDDMAEAIFTKKGIRTRLDVENVSPTMVTLPDDFIHPYFNRILTVREMARLQSFDDSFEFLGKRTTGGSQRALETPQYTQVGNAVPPLLARAIAEEVFNATQHTDNR
ncbi:DNA (cytosine-5-)-methyltransferase [Enterococcus faecalis]|uniref:DNA cytosine methyltransferase n=1 Tax=Enterococcus faecalis TaxID=1351 RepID=UPI0009BD1276|nr:DNA cytosine methyltransferase [Enterococcus faecalis]OQO72030.1 DNA (cytosine-5-)-methyltransferase [Enterococcus faecalis]